jgi:hypothetical protein
LDSETCGELLKRIASYRGAVNVVVGAASGIFDVVVFQRSVVPAKGARPSMDNCEVGESKELGLLVALLRKRRKMTQVRLTQPRYEAELVENDEEALAGV